MKKTWVSLLLLAPGLGFAGPAPEQAAKESDTALSRTAEEAAQVETASSALLEDPREVLEGIRSSFIRGIEDFQKSLREHDRTPKMGIEYDGLLGYEIIGLQESGPAAVAGVKLGDEIVMINGERPKTSWDDANKRLFEKANPVTLVVKRNGVRKPLSFTIPMEPVVLPQGFLKEYDRRFALLKSRAKKLRRPIANLDPKDSEAVGAMYKELGQLQNEARNFKRAAYTALGYELLPEF